MPEGSLVTITCGCPLNDYEAYTREGRYYVVIPKADAPRAGGSLRGRGFDDLQTQQRGDSAVISLRLKTGVHARVNQKFNRLEIVITLPGNQGKDTKAEAKPGPTPASTTPTPISPGASGNKSESGDAAKKAPEVTAAAKDKLYLKDGSIVAGQVYKFNDQSFKVRTGRSSVSLYMEDVEKVEFLDATRGGFNTIRLKDGSIIRGQVIGYEKQQFIVGVGAGGRGRRSRITIYAEDVDSIE